MKFDLKDQPDLPDDTSLVGNVYRCKGGNKTQYWVIVSVYNNTVVCLGIDRDGNITSSANYGKHVFEGCPWSRQRIGRVIEMPELNFAISWEALR